MNAIPPPTAADVAKGRPQPTLNAFTLGDLATFTPAKSFDARASQDFRLFFVGVDDVHDILKYLFQRASTSIYLNMFGYDDDELNAILMAKVQDPRVLVMITLDKSQAGGVHEKRLLDADRTSALAAFNTHFAVGQSATHQISHTKGFVIDGKVSGEGSTNWSTDGEGTFVVKGAGAAGGAGYEAQNNTQTIYTDPVAIARFQAELIAEHLVAARQATTSK